MIIEPKLKWRKLNDYLDLNCIYEVSNYGDVRRQISDSPKVYKILKQEATDKGYMRVSMQTISGRKYFKVHRLVAMVFIKNPKNKKEVNHKNGKKSDNLYLNLNWSTRKENMHHAYDTGLLNNLGERHPKSFITDLEVIEICKLIESGMRTVDIMKAVSFLESNEKCRDVVRKIKTRKTWRHISKDYNF
jgi:hypothetical protein